MANDLPVCPRCHDEPVTGGSIGLCRDCDIDEVLGQVEAQWTDHGGTMGALAWSITGPHDQSYQCIRCFYGDVGSALLSAAA